MERYERVLAQQEIAVSKLGQAITEILQHLQALSNPQRDADSQPQAAPLLATLRFICLTLKGMMEVLVNAKAT